MGCQTQTPDGKLKVGSYYLQFRISVERHSLLSVDFLWSPNAFYNIMGKVSLEQTGTRLLLSGAEHQTDGPALIWSQGMSGIDNITISRCLNNLNIGCNKQEISCNPLQYLFIC